MLQTLKRLWTRYKTPGHDHCGPQGSGLARVLSILVPDVLFTVVLSMCCKEHDDDYQHSDRRKKADLAFFDCIKCRFIAAALAAEGWTRYGFGVVAYPIALWYYLGVRGLGWIFHTGDKKNGKVD